MTLTKFSEREVCKIKEAEVIKQIYKDMSGDEMRNSTETTTVYMSTDVKEWEHALLHNLENITGVFMVSVRTCYKFSFTP